MKSKHRDDASGKVRVVITLVGVRHRNVKGNMMKVLTIHNVKVSDVAALVHRALFRVVGRVGVIPQVTVVGTPT